MPHITLVVRDYDEALAFYVGKLGFELVEDTYLLKQDKRWVTIRPPGSPHPFSNPMIPRAPCTTRTMSTLSRSIRYSTR